MNRPLRRIASGGRGAGVVVVVGGLAAFHSEGLLYLNKDALFRLVALKKKKTKQNTHANSTSQGKQALHQGKSRRAQPPSAGGRHLHGHVISSQGNCYDVGRTSHSARPRRGGRKPSLPCTLTRNRARTGSFLRLRMTHFSFLYSGVLGPFLTQNSRSYSNKYLFS